MAARAETGSTMLRLILLRHAKSAWPEGVADHDRPLAPRGAEAAPLVGAHMAKTGLRPQRVLVSTARRTRETYALAAGPASLPEAAFEPRIYEARWTDLLALVAEQPAAASPLMLIGHNPGIATLASMLCDVAASDSAAMLRLTSKVPTAALAVIDFPTATFAGISAESGRLVSFTTPKQLGGVDED
jgi:phosphohistidine phosphatase